MAAPDLSKILTGPFKVTIGDVPLGDVSPEGITVTVSKMVRERLVDRFGEQPVDIIHMGESIEVSLVMGEYVKENLAVAMPSGYAGSNYVTIGRRPGEKYSAWSGELVLHPRNAGVDTSFDITVYKAVNIGDAEIPLSVASDRLISVTFRGLIDADRTNMDMLAKFAAPARS